VPRHLETGEQPQRSDPAARCLMWSSGKDFARFLARRHTQLAGDAKEASNRWWWLQTPPGTPRTERVEAPTDSWPQSGPESPAHSARSDEPQGSHAFLCDGKPLSSYICREDVCERPKHRLEPSFVTHHLWHGAVDCQPIHRPPWGQSSQGPKQLEYLPRRRLPSVSRIQGAFYIGPAKYQK
jgi:hypothetical protein